MLVEVLTRINENNMFDVPDIDIVGDWVKIYQADEEYQCRSYIEKKAKKEKLVMRLHLQNPMTVSIVQKPILYYTPNDGWVSPDKTIKAVYDSMLNKYTIYKLDFLLGRVGKLCKWEMYAGDILNQYGVERMLRRAFRVDNMSLYCVSGGDDIQFYYKGLSPLTFVEVVSVITTGGNLPTWY